MNISISRERAQGEQRVALVPGAVADLVRRGHRLKIEHEAGSRAGFSDDAYRAAGAELHKQDTLYKRAHIVLRVRRPEYQELSLVPPNAVLIGFLEPVDTPWYVEILASAGLTAISIDAIPTDEDSCKVDALTAQNRIEGYKAAIMAAYCLPRLFPAIAIHSEANEAAKVLILGGGAAGLQAATTAFMMGAMVVCADGRPEMRAAIEATGATFLKLPTRQTAQKSPYASSLSRDRITNDQWALREAIRKADVIISNVREPGKKAPILIDESSVKTMKMGAMIIDLAAAHGGNCIYTVARETIYRDHVQIIGAVSLAASIPAEASELLSESFTALLDILIDGHGELVLDMRNPVIKTACLTHDGSILHQQTKDALLKSGRPEPTSNFPYPKSMAV
jgi:H+-translocating NAD(P) transhydrogenase subunit alpha